MTGIALEPSGCNEGARYRVLSFFFDGVPTPGWMAQSQPTSGPLATTSSSSKPSGAGQSEMVASLHAPFQTRQCPACHASPDGSFQAGSEIETCRNCHPSYYRLKPDDWMHGPVAIGKCAMCHKGHKSDYAGLLVKPQTELCFSCHQSADVLSRPYHKEAHQKPCSTCHDPHSAGNRHLLADSRTYQRRALHVSILSSPHASWDKSKCVSCHVSERSNQLIEDVNKVCLSCHAKVQSPTVTAASSPQAIDGMARPPLHDPVRKGQCVNCHAGHKSSRPHLIKPLAEQICLSCHKLKEIETDAHPPVHRADCLLCHTGHQSPRKHLLRNDIEPAGPARPHASSAPVDAARAQQ